MAGILRLGAPDPMLVIHARRVAALMDFDGRQTMSAARHIHRCTHYHRPTGATILYTRDTGHHTSGWWKNPDYDRCLHLSLSFDGGFDRRMAKRWAEAFFAGDTSLLWLEPPYSPEGKMREVWHYRLFCDAGWQPIQPRGEVYSTDWTPAGWKSFSEAHAAEMEPAR